MNRKKIVIAIFALALVIGILSGIYTATRPEAQVGSKTITITVVHKDGTEKNYEYMTDAETLDVVLALVIGILSGIYTATRPEAQVGSKTITITVVHKDGTEKNYEYMTDAETLDVVLLDNNLVTGYEGPYGLTIESVDGETADWNVDQSYWCLYVNGEYAVTGASDTKIFDGDSFSLVYTIG